jgi:serine/threonine-protein kinase
MAATTAPRHNRQALEIWEASLGPIIPTSPSLAPTSAKRCVLSAIAKGRGGVSRSAFDTGATLGADHPLCAGNLANLGSAALDAGDFVEAEHWYDQALGTWQRRLGSDDAHLATALIGLGEALVGQRRFARAVAVYERALAIETEALGQEHPDLAEPLSGLGQAYLGLGHNQRAREKLEQALSLEERRPSDPALLATVRLALARALWQLKVDGAKARALAEAARDGFTKVGRRGERGLKNAADLLATMY